MIILGTKNGDYGNLRESFLLMQDSCQTDCNLLQDRISICRTEGIFVVRPALMAQFDAPSDWRPGGRGFHPCRGRQHSFMEIDHKIFSTVILFLPLIQEGQLSVSGVK